MDDGAHGQSHGVFKRSRRDTSFIEIDWLGRRRDQIIETSTRYMKRITPISTRRQYLNITFTYDLQAASSWRRFLYNLFLKEVFFVTLFTGTRNVDWWRISLSVKMVYLLLKYSYWWNSVYNLSMENGQRVEMWATEDRLFTYKRILVTRAHFLGKRTTPIRECPARGLWKWAGLPTDIIGSKIQD